MKYEYWKNVSLNDIIDEIDGVIYKEEWKDINGFEGDYMISTFSRVKSLYKEYYGGWHKKQRMVREEKIMKCSQTVNKYIIASLSKNLIETKIFTHVLSATAFIEMPDIEDPTVDHISTIKTQNHISNLRWVTRQHNSVLAAQMGLNGAYPSILTSEDVLKIYNDIRKARVLSEEYKVSTSTVYLIKSGKHYGYITGKKYKPTKTQ